MNFREAESYLYSLGNEVTAMKLGLDAMRVLLGELGEPQNRFLKVQVAGTNGKGSVCAFLDAICNAAGIATGTFTSPHLVSITERIRVNGADISEAEFARHASTVREACERLVARGELDPIPTFFEQVTAIALTAFADAGVEVAILETGLGGRLDATTAANAEIAVITRIDLDHQQYLGETIEEIAAEKAAIIHQRSRVVLGEQSSEAMNVILDRCRAMSVTPSRAPSLPVRFPPGSLGLRGGHQVENAAIAASTAREIGREFDISEDEIAEGSQNARHPGRLEYSGRYLFDGAHNIAGVRALADFLGENETRPITLIFGAMDDKDVGEIASIIFPLAERIVLTRPDNPRSSAAAELARLGERETIKTENVADAVETAEDITPADGLILVTGSLYLVGEVKRILNN